MDRNLVSFLIKLYVSHFLVGLMVHYHLILSHCVYGKYKANYASSGNKSCNLLQTEYILLVTLKSHLPLTSIILCKYQKESTTSNSVGHQETILCTVYCEEGWH